MKIISTLMLLFFCSNLFCQQVVVLTQDTKTSIRGLSVVNDYTIWVSGSNGTVGLSVDAGKSIKWMQVPGYDSIDFRDIEAFSSTEAVIMGIGSPAYVLKTDDAGKTWKLIYKNEHKEMFLDAMEWWNQQSGIIIGDPIDGKPFFIRTFDEGASWIELPKNKLPNLATGEACFASSGTNITAFGKKEAIFITGGKQSRFFKRDTAIEIPIIQGKESTGANSVAVNKKLKNLIIVGGDFTNKDDTTQNCVISNNGGKSFQQSKIPPKGYRSSVCFSTKNKAITCGLNGVDISTDYGNTWKNISKEGFHVCKKAKFGKAIYFAGSNGKIGKLIK